MKSKKYPKPKPASSKAEEPGVLYEKAIPGKELRIFHSFEEVSKAESETIALQNPVQRLRNTVELILRAYGFTRESLKDRKPKNNLTINQYE